MKGNKPIYDWVVLLGGTGSRMGQTNYSNKALIPINGRSPLERMVEKIIDLETAGYTFENKIAVVNQSSANDVIELLGSEFQYQVQEKPDGIANAMKIANPKNPFILYLGDQVFSEPVGRLLEGFSDSSEAVRMWLRNTPTYYNHSTVVLDEDNNFKRIIEKPQWGGGSYPISVGVYCFKPNMLGFVSRQPVDERGEKNLSDLISTINSYGFSIGYRFMDETQPWIDAGTPENFKLAEEYFK